MRKLWSIAAAVTALSIPSSAQVKEAPGCTHETAQRCVALALDAMGGRDRFVELKSMRLETIGHTLLVEQSYRQAPFITSYAHGKTTLDFANQRFLREAKLTWPEADANQSDADYTWVVGPDGGVTRGKTDSPCSLATIDSAREMLELGPARVLLTASAAADLHFEASEMLRSSSHAVVAFTWHNLPVRVLLNQFNHLPDAVDTIQEFHDFWFFWGDVHQRVYWDNWKLTNGLALPTNWIVERNGILWSSAQALNVELNVPIDEKDFAMDAKIAKQSAASKGWNRGFGTPTPTTLAPGIDLYSGAWNSTVVKQADGIVILEAPISGVYTQGVLETAKKQYPDSPIKAVLSTSDSWPHTGGVRFAVSEGLPIYILDLNRPLLDKMVAASHTLDPDALQESKAPKHPNWKIVAEKQTIGSGANRIELYPLRGASTERQYMAYFPESRLLYASDTLSLNGDGSLYDPELMHEVAQAVKRANLEVNTVFAMHQGPMPWAKVMELLEKSEHS